jgi:hypothetical protein
MTPGRPAWKPIVRATLYPAEAAGECEEPAPVTLDRPANGAGM